MTAAIPTLSSQYDPTQSEAKWQQFWEDNQIFKADPSQGGETYSVVIPPPNVTGRLHMGHAFNTSLIDTLVRYHRMTGKNTLCLPGTDHASIAVQTILEKQLQAEGKTREDVGREEFLKRAWEWRQESGGEIVNQLRRLGYSVDWTRERFTLDEGLSQSVLEAFIKLYEEGLIYRGKYLVNWCPASQSAVSDLEVEQKEVDGKLWHFQYPFVAGEGYVEIATTRPETMLGDTAVAVNPNDERYKDLVGKMLKLPLVDREIPVIADEHVDPEFGTGCVKVTPAHDPNDFEMGVRHSLPFINILNKDGSINENGGDFQGQDRFEARKNVLAALDEVGSLVQIEDHKHTVPYSDRGKVPVEPLLSTQWFVKIDPLSSEALGELDDQNSPEFVPARWTKVYRDWLTNLRDWCISRQLWWGHQIPAWYVVSETDGKITDNSPFVVAHNTAEAQAKAIAEYGEGAQIEQDPDVLDTWFSSGLWPFSTLGWPEQTDDLAQYYPTSTLVTGFDIIFFWVARMTMMAGHFTGKMPFEHVYIHGLVRDENGEKMSKSKNNGIDPLLLIEQYGTDALRFAMIREVAGAGQDIRLDFNRKTNESKTVEGARNFNNKLWNASRFVLMNLDGQTPAQLGVADQAKLELSDRWILSRFNQVTQTMRRDIEQHALGEAAKLIYEFIWGDFCDWYIELVKSRLNGEDKASRKVAQQTLAHVLEGILKLLHPFMPHITEEIWHTLTQQPAAEIISLAKEVYPEVDAALIDSELEQDFTLLIGTIRTVRNLRAEAGIKPGERIEALMQTESDREHRVLTDGWFYIKDLAKVDHLSVSQPNGARTMPISDEELAIFDRTRPWADKSWREMNWQERLQIGEAFNLVGDFFRTYQRSLLSLGAIGLFVFVLELCKAILETVNQVPFLPSFLEIVGLGYAIWYGKQNIWDSGDRQRLWQQVQQLKQDVVGTPRLVGTAEPTDVTADDAASGNQMFAGVVGTIQVLIPLAGLVDVDALRAKLEKKLDKAQNEIKSLSGRLGNSKFVDKAPTEVVQEVRNSLAEAQKQSEIIRDRLDLL
ncbi:valine--tRNA ligase [filamentous cyanobacterium LEGE 11480]|uniref:Valine--tRNA ligase n=1 Tax=Romeriopsis navalis LEGE 11480 TaxID=2777977 RepID=A0A928Z4B6_9CYAN|nr:valine--tRNA ligase [Romeriopsis navalis]MBE9031594.1 valine--tRNA ligase [Romeriopsis navalis LEGE 11480]